MTKKFKTPLIHLINLGLLSVAMTLHQGVLQPGVAQTTPGDDVPITPGPAPTSQSDINMTNQSDANTDATPGFEDPPADTPFINGVPNEIATIETSFAGVYASKFGPFYGEAASADVISQELKKLAKATGTNPALLYVLKTGDGLQLVLVTAEPNDPEVGRIEQAIQVASSQPLQLGQAAPATDDRNNPNVTFVKVPEATLGKVSKVAKEFRLQISDPVDFKSKSYLDSAQQLHQWLVQPLATELEQKKIDTIIFSMDTGLRSLPLAALHDGQQFLVEQYNLALIPSFSLTDTRYAPIQGKQVLGMGITQEVEGQSPLPSVAVEIPALTNTIWQGSAYLDPDVTLANLQKFTQRQQFDIIHLATHAEFNPGKIDQSFIQLWDGKLTLKDLREVATQSKWNDTPTVELLVLSACQTALGNTDAELGFTGLAIQSGVKSALGSLWYVSDEGTLGLMTGFYQNLKTAPIKSAALRQAQVAMLSGQVRVTDEAQLVLADGTQIALPDIFAERGTVDFTHPYYWSAFTMVGNWN